MSTPVDDAEFTPSTPCILISSTLPCCPLATAVKSAADLHRLHSGSTLRYLVDFVKRLNAAVRGTPISAPVRTCTAVRRLGAVLDALRDAIALHPPVQQAMRFGNTAFRDWHTAVQMHADGAARCILGLADTADFKAALLDGATSTGTSTATDTHHSADTVVEGVAGVADLDRAVVEVRGYLIASLGNATRIDYGTGHELAFAALLCCLERLGVVPAECYAALVLRAFAGYLRLVRVLQQTYMLEPAGSHGVWSLDDYHFLPFLWGASQLVDAPTNGVQLGPGDVLRESVLEQFGDDYMYLDSIRYIHRQKTGPFFEHSPTLFDVTRVPHWRKVNTGMIKMWRGEVIAKFPVMQHFLFGGLLPFPDLAELEGKAADSSSSSSSSSNNSSNSGGTNAVVAAGHAGPVVAGTGSSMGTAPPVTRMPRPG